MEKRWLNPDDLFQEFGISKSTQAKMRMHRSGSGLPYTKFGKFIRYDRMLIDKWLEEHNVQGRLR